jgi:hypothetical protein
VVTGEGAQQVLAGKVDTFKEDNGAYARHRPDENAQPDGPDQLLPGDKTDARLDPRP